MFKIHQYTHKVDKNCHYFFLKHIRPILFDVNYPIRLSFILDYHYPCVIGVLKIIWFNKFHVNGANVLCRHGPFLDSYR